jgi:hypothetical protein
MLVQRILVQKRAVGKLVHITRTILGHGCERRCITWSTGKPNGEWSSSGIIARLTDIRIVQLTIRSSLLTSKYQKNVEILYGSEGSCVSARRDEGRCT